MIDEVRILTIKFSVIAWLCCVTACGDDVTQKCNELGLPKCDGEVAVNCDALCTMYSCDVEEVRTACGDAARCEVRTIQQPGREPEEKVEAICVAQPATSCESGHTACSGEDTWETCHAEAKVLVRTRCPPGQRCGETSLTGYFSCK